MVGVDVAAEGGLRAANVACHTVQCHLQLKFAEFLFFLSNWRDLLHFHIMSRVTLVQREFIFFFWGWECVDGFRTGLLPFTKRFCAAAVCRKISYKAEAPVYF